MTRLDGDAVLPTALLAILGHVLVVPPGPQLGHEVMAEADLDLTGVDHNDVVVGLRSGGGV